MPRVSVIMPVYNCENYIRQSVESILGQTFEDFEFLIIDDASTDQTVRVIKSYNDPRIRLVEKPANSGYPDSLNMGLKIATGEFIARMDGDDISRSDRFALQLDEFAKNENLVLCGSFMEIIGTGEIVQYPKTHDAIKVELLKICCIAHPSVMYKRAFLLNNNLFYDTSKEPAEDFHLWMRMIKNGMFLNISQPLLQYRIHANQVSTKKQQLLVKSGIETKVAHLSSITSEANARRFFGLYEIIAEGSVAKEMEWLAWLDKAIVDLEEKNKSVSFFAREEFSAFLNDYKRSSTRAIFLNSKVYNITKLNCFIRKKAGHPGYFSNTEFFKNAIKCLMFYRVK